MTIVISAFPACGKTYASKHYSQFLNISDSDSSLFSRTGVDGVRNPNFPGNYVMHMKTLIEEGQTDLIFVSSHKEVRDLMSRCNITFYTVYPKSGLMNEWVNRMIARGNDDRFISFIKNNWVEYMFEVDNGGTIGCKLFRLGEGEYLDLDLIRKIQRYDSSLNITNDYEPLLSYDYRL